MEGAVASLTTVSGLLTFAATAGVISALLNQVFGIARDWVTARTKRKSEAGYLALRLAALLEGYAYTCASFIGDMSVSTSQQSPDEQYPEWNTKLPPLPTFPEEKEGWHSIDLKLAARALDLRNHLAGSQGVIDTTVEFAMDDLEDELEEHAGERGREAWTLAEDLRRRYGLPPFVPVWDFTRSLEDAVKRARKAKDERAQSQAEMLQELAADDARATTSS
jgi:hypothetical protein